MARMSRQVVSTSILLLLVSLAAHIARGQVSQDELDTWKQRSRNFESAYELTRVLVDNSRNNTEDLDAMRKQLKENDPKLSVEVQVVEERCRQDMQSFPDGYTGDKNYHMLHIMLFQMLKDVNQSLADYQGLAARESAQAEAAKARLVAARTELGELKRVLKERDETIAIQRERIAALQEKLDAKGKTSGEPVDN